MFPDYDDLVLYVRSHIDACFADQHQYRQSVLESVQGNQDRAVDLLLRLSDPEYRGDPEPAVTVAPQPQHPMVRCSLLPFRRSAHPCCDSPRQIWTSSMHGNCCRKSSSSNSKLGKPDSSSSSGPTLSSRVHNRVEIRWQRYNNSLPRSRKVSQKKSFIFLQRFVNEKLAGKKTFGTIFSKVKAKIQDIDQQRYFISIIASSSLTISLPGRAKDPLILQPLHAGIRDQTMAMTPRSMNSRRTSISRLNHHMLHDHRDSRSNHHHHHSYRRAPRHLRTIQRRPSGAMTRRQSTLLVCLSCHYRKRRHLTSSCFIATESGSAPSGAVNAASSSATSPRSIDGGKPVSQF